MNISLTPQLEQLIRTKVESGRYLSASEVVRDALRLLEQRDQLQQARLETLRQEIAIGTQQLQLGETIDGDTVFQELYEDIRQHVQTQ